MRPPADRPEQSSWPPDVQRTRDEKRRKCVRFERGENGIPVCLPSEHSEVHPATSPPSGPQHSHAACAPPSPHRYSESTPLVGRHRGRARSLEDRGSTLLRSSRSAAATTRKNGEMRDLTRQLFPVSGNSERPPPPVILSLSSPVLSSGSGSPAGTQNARATFCPGKEPIPTTCGLTVCVQPIKSI